MQPTGARCYDQHLHSCHSFDCRTPPEANVVAALDRGLAGLTFTEHFDTHSDEWPECLYDDAKIEAELALLRDRYGDRCFIGKGIEVCYQPKQMAFIAEFLAAHRFDLVMVSVHWAAGRPTHRRARFDNLSAEAFIRVYLEEVRDATAHLAALRDQGAQPFHVLGHLDLAKRYAGRWHGHDAPIDEPQLVDDILRNCRAAGIIPEINTSTWRAGLQAPMPGREVLEAYAALGGTAVSLGSDSHSADHIGSHFDEALTLMRQAGLGHLALFRSGALHLEPIAGAAAAP